MHIILGLSQILSGEKNSFVDYKICLYVVQCKPLIWETFIFLNLMMMINIFPDSSIEPSLLVPQELNYTVIRL